MKVGVLGEKVNQVECLVQSMVQRIRSDVLWEKKKDFFFFFLFSLSHLERVNAKGFMVDRLDFERSSFFLRHTRTEVKERSRGLTDAYVYRMSTQGMPILCMNPL